MMLITSLISVLIYFKSRGDEKYNVRKQYVVKETFEIPAPFNLVILPLMPAPKLRQNIAYHNFMHKLASISRSTPA